MPNSRKWLLSNEGRLNRLNKRSQKFEWILQRLTDTEIRLTKTVCDSEFEGEMEFIYNATTHTVTTKLPNSSGITETLVRQIRAHVWFHIETILANPMIHSEYKVLRNATKIKVPTEANK